MMEQIDVSKLSFEEALDRLETLVGTIDSGELPLAEAIDAFKLATALREHCAGLLEQAETAIEELVADDATVTLEAGVDNPAEIDEASPFVVLEDEPDEPFGNPFGDD